MTVATARWPTAALVFLLGLLALAGSAAGHALQPGYLELRLTEAESYSVLWKKPAVRGRPMAISALLPETCQPRRPPEPVWDGSAWIARWTARCAGGLENGTIRIEGLERTATDVLVRFDFADGAAGTHRLTASGPVFTVPTQPSALEVARTYLVLGVRHILSGIDHLLFVLALLILVDGMRRLVATVTAFTLAHSLTLAAATLGYVRVPGPPVEAVIALSIALVAAEILRARKGETGLTQRFPWVVAFTFGLLHGFGFAGALAEIGLPQKAIPVALLLFNVGVEIGQLIFIAAVLALMALGRAATRPVPLPLPDWARALPVYAIGGIAGFWIIDRLAGFL